MSQDQLVLEFAEQSLRLSDLSDGYRNMLAMTADIAIRCATLNPALEAETVLATPGVVLIDEIDLHLHPKWQRRVRRRYAADFPAYPVCCNDTLSVCHPVPAHAMTSSSLNLDNESANDFTNKSVEDITEEVQGVELPQRSKRFNDMMAVAKRYYAMLNDAAKRAAGQLENLKQQLDELSAPFSDDPAYQSFLQMQRLASGIDKEKP